MATSFNYSALKGKIKEVFDTQGNFAKALGISEGTLTAKLGGTSFFTQGEIFKSVHLLGIKEEDINVYFFTS